MQWIENFLSQYRSVYFIHQFLTIFIIFLSGFIMTTLSFAGPLSGDSNKIRKSASRLKSAALAFPTGLAAFVLIGYVILITGIPYNSISVSVFALIVLVLLLLCAVKKGLPGIIREDIRSIIVILVAALIFIMIATSGLIKISVSNDSLYYFWQYPRAIVYYGGLRDQFDNFLTDTGMGAAVIGTLPFLFGFGQTFAIQEFFHMSFVLFFGVTVYEEAARLGGRGNASELFGESLEDNTGSDNQKHSLKEWFDRISRQGKVSPVIAAVLAALLIASCTPSYILAHWAMSNMYFMELFFISMVLLRDVSCSSLSGKTGALNGNSDFISLLKEDAIRLFVPALIMIMTSLFRMEGGIFILFMVMTISMLESDKRVLVLEILPVVILQSLFEVKIYCSYNIDNPYIFLTKGKALIQFVAYIAVIIYIYFVRDKLGKIKRWIPKLFILGLLLVNVILLLLDHVTYIANLRAFIGNLTGQSGWGILPYLLVGAVVIILWWEYLLNRKSSKKVIASEAGPSEDSTAGSLTGFWLFTTIGFLLVAFAVSFARGDAMYISTGDSGNRVLLQITPLLIMYFELTFVRLLDQGE